MKFVIDINAGSDQVRLHRLLFAVSNFLCIILPFVSGTQRNTLSVFSQRRYDRRHTHDPPGHAVRLREGVLHPRAQGTHCARRLYLAQWSQRYGWTDTKVECDIYSVQRRLWKSFLEKLPPRAC